jgi:hypothetical protein
MILIRCKEVSRSGVLRVIELTIDVAEQGGALPTSTSVAFRLASYLTRVRGSTILDCDVAFGVIAMTIVTTRPMEEVSSELSALERVSNALVQLDHARKLSEIPPLVEIIKCEPIHEVIVPDYLRQRDVFYHQVVEKFDMFFVKSEQGELRMILKRIELVRDLFGRKCA